MKQHWFLWVVGLALSATMAHAEVVATAESPAGKFESFRVVLDAEGEPVAVANFMGLADGSQGWVDPIDGHVRGGAGDAFYKGMVFDLCEGAVVQGGLRGTEGEEGTEYTAGPGYTVLGKTDEAWTAYEWGALVLSENGGPHSGGSEVAFYLTNGVTPWTVFGRVRAGDEAGAEALKAAVAAAVATGGVVEVRWKVDAGDATESESAALDAARARLPVPGEMEARLADEGDGFEWDWPPKTRLLIRGGNDLVAGLPILAGGWHEMGVAVPMDLKWEELGLAGGRGFAALTGVAYPAWSGGPLTGKWRMGMDHTGMRIQYWFDFDGRTGMMARVVSGEITDRAIFSNLEGWRDVGNGWTVFFGTGLVGNYYYLGFAEAGAMEGRFKSLQQGGTYSSDWGMFEMAEGWGENGGKGRGKCTMHDAECTEDQWVEWGDGKGGWRDSAELLGWAEVSGAVQHPIRRVKPKGKRTGRSGGKEQFDIRVFGVGGAGPEEDEAGFDLGEEGRGGGGGGCAEGVGDGGFDGDGFVEASVESEGDGEGVAEDGVVRGKGDGLPGESEDFGGGGG